MNILVISNYYPEHIGGIEFVAENLVSRWRKKHRVIWMACDVTSAPHQPAPEDVLMPAWNITEERLGFPYPFPFPLAWARIFNQVCKNDVIHLHDCLYSANTFAFFVARLAQKPVLITQHVGYISYGEKYKNLLQHIAYLTFGRTILQTAEQVVFVNENVRDWFAAFTRFRRPPLLVPNGVDSSLFFPAEPVERENWRKEMGIPQEYRVLLFVGRFTHKKGLHLIRMLAEARPSYRWILVGKGELDPRDWDLPNVVTIASQPHSQLRRYYAIADLLILPSTGEGFPLSAQEALACGLPVALSAETAAHMPDSPYINLSIASLSSMLAVLDGLLSSSNRLEDLRQASVEYAKRWDWETVARQYEEILQEIVRDKQERPPFLRT